MEDQQEDLNLVIEQICEEKGIQKEKVIETIEAAVASAFRKDYGSKNQELEVKFDLETNTARIFDVKEVVEEPKEDEEGKIPKLKRGQIALKDAKELKKDAKIGDIIKTEVTPKSAEYGRIAAQTAKQVIIQKIREAERDAIFNEFKEKEGEILTGIIQRVEGGNVYIDLGRAVGVLYPSEAIKNEVYDINHRIKVYVAAVRTTPKGPEIIVSRSSPKMLKKLFEAEVPEMKAGTVEIKAVAREAGSRAKIAVSGQEGIDPIGAFVGQRGTRVQTVINELSGEKIDIIEWDEDPVKFITNALAPAKVVNVILNNDKKEATAMVEKDQLSLAIGKNGQNVRLAARLTGWKIDILQADTKEEKASSEPKEESKKKIKKIKSSKETSERNKKEAKRERKEGKKEEGKPEKGVDKKPESGKVKEKKLEKTSHG